MNKKSKILFILSISTLLISGCSNNVIENKVENKEPKKQTQNKTNKPKPIEEVKVQKGVSLDELSSANNTLTDENVGVNTDIWFLNTGMSDSILIKDHDEFMLIDTGDSNDSEIVKKALKDKGVKKLKYLILTNWDFDAIGNVKEVFDNCIVDTVITSKISSTTPKIGKDAFSFIGSKGARIKYPEKEGENYILYMAQFKIYNISTGSLEENEKSLVIELDAGNTKSLFTSDLLPRYEEKILNSLGKIDLLKVARHGASDATTEKFLSKTMPTYSVILTGEVDNSNNKQKIDSKDVEIRLNKFKSKVFKTSISGEVHFKVDNSGLYHN